MVGLAAGEHVAPVPAPELDRLGDEIAELAAHLHAATYRLLVRLREFDVREGWGGGFRSCAHWLSWRTGIAPGAAREKVRVAHALAQLPHISAALERGQLSYAKVRAVTRIASPANEAELLELALTATAAQVERIVRAWRQLQRAEEATHEGARHEQRDVTIYPDDDGSFVIRGRLDPEVGALLARALEAAAAALYPSFEPTTTAGQRRADAIGLITELALASRTLDTRVVAESPLAETRDAAALAVDQCDATRASAAAVSARHGCDAAPERRRPETARPQERASVGQHRTTGRAERYQVVVHIDAAPLRAGCDAGSGAMADIRIPAETARRLACDASRVVMTHDVDGSTLDVGRRTRTVSPALRRALDHRDRGCRFPGCDNRFCDAHHIQHWADGGATRLNNLLLLCRRHHRAVHEDGFRVVANSVGGFTFCRPDGMALPEVPAAPPLTRHPVAAVMELHRRLDLGIDASTALSRWNGERLDLDFAITSSRGLRFGV